MPANIGKLLRICETTVFLFILSVLMLPATAPANPPKHLTATMETTMYGKTSQAKLYLKGRKVRIEALGGRQFSTMIARYDLDELWLLHPTAQKYKKMGVDAMDRKVPHFFSPGLTIEKHKLAEEVLNGGKAIKYEALIRDSKNRAYKGFLWEAKQFPAFPAKWEDPAQGLIVEWKNPSDKELADSLFEIPQGFTAIPHAVTPPERHQGQHAPK